MNPMLSFPPVQGRNLEGRLFHLPDDFAGALNIVFVAFEQYHQPLVNSWLPFVGRLKRKYPEICDYELPVAGDLPPVAQQFVDMGMRQGIPSRAVREKTITLYMPSAAFCTPLGLPNDRQIYTLVVDRSGRVLTRIVGPFSDEKGRTLETAVFHAQVIV